MSAGLEAVAWDGARGAKWRATLTDMEAMLAPVDAPLLAALALEGAHRIADVGCGGGATTRALAARAPALARLEGFDVSAELVAAARACAHERVAFTHADAATFVPAERFDRLASRFGVMFFDAPEAAFANLARWLVPGGRFAFAVWGPAEENPWFGVVRDAVARAVSVPPIVETAPGPFRYGRGTAFTELLERTGFADVEVREWRGELGLGGGAERAAAFALGGFGSFAELLARADARARVEAQLAAELRTHERAGEVRLGAHVRIVSGRVR